MTLEKHVTDTMKEWQIKIGDLGDGIELYYPKASLCEYLGLDSDTENLPLSTCIEEYFGKHAKFLGEISVSVSGDRFCLRVGKKGCDYVKDKVPKPEFLVGFLEALKRQKMAAVQNCFEEYAQKKHTRVCMEKENDGIGTVFYFEDENVEPYVYCVEENEFGVTYHRFTRKEYKDL